MLDYTQQKESLSNLPSLRSPVMDGNSPAVSATSATNAGTGRVLKRIERSGAWGPGGVWIDNLTGSFYNGKRLEALQLVRYKGVNAAS